jgi:hypothetical protein
MRGYEQHILAKVTVAYNAEEDRLQIHGKDFDSVNIELWLTRRVTSSLLRHITRFTTINFARPTEPSLSCNISEEVPTPELTPAPINFDRHLFVDCIEIIEVGELTRFIFSDKQGSQPVRLDLSPQDFHRWVNGLRAICDNAGWNLMAEWTSKNEGPIKLPHLNFTKH